MSLTVTASAMPAEPCQYSKVSIYVQVDDGSGGVAGASVTSTWYYRTTTSYESGTTDSSGEAVLTRSISSATAGYTVQVAVRATHDDATGTAYTSFTPRNC
jgi:hypothetical protein